jgi:large subunit ribosomal protein L7/L12
VVGGLLPLRKKTDSTSCLEASANKVSVIKAVREITGLGLSQGPGRRSKNVKEAIAKADAEA